jgi:putative transposase
MPRALRVTIPGVALHIIQRGNNRAACFREDSDFLFYLASLRLLAYKHDCAIHAYCLMTNHVHLLLTPASGEACKELMRNLGQRYVQYFNRRHGRTGTLWEGRFRSCLVESARYILACHRYIELNPVRAGMVACPAQFLWSSHAANSGMRADPMLTPHPEYLALSADPAARHAAYRELVGTPSDASILKEIRNCTNGGYPLCSDAFKAKVVAPLGAKLVPGKPGPRAQCPSANYEHDEFGL